MRGPSLNANRKQVSHRLSSGTPFQASCGLCPILIRQRLCHAMIYCTPSFLLGFSIDGSRVQTPSKLPCGWRTSIPCLPDSQTARKEARGCLPVCRKIPEPNPKIHFACSKPKSPHSPTLASMYLNEHDLCIVDSRLPCCHTSAQQTLGRMALVHLHFNGSQGETVPNIRVMISGEMPATPTP